MSLKFKIWLLCLSLIIAWKVAGIVRAPEDLRPRNLSTIDTATLYYPQWACGDCPDYLLLTMSKDENQAYALTDVYFSPPAGFWSQERYAREFQQIKFTCLGKVKASPEICSEACSGQQLKVFYADYCEKSKMTDEDWALVEKFHNE